MKSAAILIRHAEIEDSDDLFEWRNDKITRDMSMNSEPVDRNSHDDWLVRVLADKNRRLYIAMLGDEKLGVCRLDLQQPADSAEVSININPSFRGRGFAKFVLEKSIEKFFADIRPMRLTAKVKIENIQSKKSFESVGFVLEREVDGLNFFILDSV